MARRMIEKRRRGVFGWATVVLFWGWNALMAATLFNGLASVGELGQQTMTAAERSGHEAGATLGFAFVLMVWALGAVIFGLLAYFTRGRRELIEMEA